MPTSENPGREAILARIRAALKVPAKVSDSPGHVHAGPAAIFAPILDPLNRFQRECAANNTELILANDPAERNSAVRGILESLPAGEIFAQDAPTLRDSSAGWKGNRPLRWSKEGGPLESSQASITLAESLVAQTGSVCISSACGGRGASVAVPVHIVLASIDQLVPDIDAAFARATERGTAAKNSYLCLITGSSRTADIEKILVMGAHGPKRLVVILSLS